MNGGRWRGLIPCLLAAMCLLFSATAPARTLMLGERDIDKLALLHEQHPRAGWAGGEPIPGHFSDNTLYLIPGQAILVRYPIDKIPPKQRIVNAEITLPSYSATDWYRLYVWRVMADWGPGVSHLFRRVRPEKVSWAVPGARGPGVDRAVEPTRVFKMKAGGLLENRIDVTRDVALWYSGAAKNHGWLLSAEDEGHSFFLYSIASGHGAYWRLQITYEPQ